MAGLLFVSVNHGAGIRRASYLCIDCAKNVDKNWNITVSFIIHVNFDHAWAEHYPVTLNFFSKIYIWESNTMGSNMSLNLWDSPGFLAIVPHPGRLYYGCIIGPRRGPDTGINTGVAGVALV